MRAMAEKSGTHMSLQLRSQVKVRLPRGNDASSIWLINTSLGSSPYAKNTLRRDHRKLFLVLWPCLPRIERERR
jgi:hypothetical protein